MRTSITHPLQIAVVRPHPSFGRIGVTFCPGKQQPNAVTGAWRRDLGLDLDAIANWGAVAVVTLLEEHELRTLAVQDLGEEARLRHMAWVHAPIMDVSVPDGDFESVWRTEGEGLRARLRSGFDVLIHCKGGLGRAGTVAARLMAELGVPAEEAIRKVRAARPGAIETSAQEAHCLAVQPIPEAQPATTHAAILDRAEGALLGLAVGDALGTTLEFRARDSYEPLTTIVGGGPFGLEAGQWTDDTAMALALADSLAECGGLDEQDLLRRFVNWWREGAYSCTGRCFDIGGTTAQALSRWLQTRASVCGSTSPYSAGNGSLMRLAPVAIRFWNDRASLRDAAARQSRTTHAAPEAVDACVVYAEMLARAIAGEPRATVMSAHGDWAGAIQAIVDGSWRGKPRHQIRASGYVAHSLEAALWSIGRSATFRETALSAANLGEDADTTAAIAGQLGGAIYGVSGMPPEWVKALSWSDRLRSRAAFLASAA